MLFLAGLLGTLHAGFSLYWGLGGTWLLDTLGERMVDAFAGWEWLLVLVAWGGLNTVVGNLVLTGVVVPDDGYDRLGMVGHALLWDPLFLLWGLALAVGLRQSARD